MPVLKRWYMDEYGKRMMTSNGSWILSRMHLTPTLAGFASQERHEWESQGPGQSKAKIIVFKGPL